MTANTMYAILAVLSGIMIVDTRAKHVLAGYVAIAIVTTVMTYSSVDVTLGGLLLFSIATALKVVVAPIGILWFIRLNSEAEDLRSSAPLPIRVLVVIVLIVLSRAAYRLPAAAGLPLQSIVAFVVLCGIAMLIMHRNVLADLLGLLLFGAGITLEAALIAPELPAGVELGAAFDVLVTTFIGLALLRTLHHRGLLDVDRLRNLRG
jgi:hydrogenase-4 membrane subunit HyfE